MALDNKVVNIATRQGDRGVKQAYTSITAEVVTRHVQLFISNTVLYHCGQMTAETFTLDFLPGWMATARHLLDAFTETIEEASMSDGKPISRPKQSEELVQCKDRLRAALRDAEEEYAHTTTTRAPRARVVSFAKPLARRIVHHRYDDRLSLRTVSEVTSSRERSSSASNSCSESHTSPSLGRWPTDRPKLLASPLPRRTTLTYDATRDSISTSPAISRPVIGTVYDGDCTPASPTEHYTGRASGVYYGDAFTHTCLSPDVDCGMYECSGATRCAVSMPTSRAHHTPSASLANALPVIAKAVTRQPQTREWFALSQPRWWWLTAACLSSALIMLLCYLV